MACYRTTTPTVEGVKLGSCDFTRECLQQVQSLPCQQVHIDGNQRQNNVGAFTRRRHYRLLNFWGGCSTFTRADYIPP